MKRMVKEILTNFANSIKDLVEIGVITSEHFETTNRNKLNETHSLIWGVLCHSVYQTVEKTYVATVEHGFKPKDMRKFTSKRERFRV